MYDEIVAALRAARLARGLTQRQLALYTGVKRATISSMESGRRSAYLRTVTTLSSYLGLRVTIEKTDA